MRWRTRRRTEGCAAHWSVVTTGLLLLVSGAFGDTQWRAFGETTSADGRPSTLSSLPPGREANNSPSKASVNEDFPLQDAGPQTFPEIEGSGDSVVLVANAQEDPPDVEENNETVVSETGGVVEDASAGESGVVQDPASALEGQTEGVSSVPSNITVIFDEAQDELADELLDEVLPTSQPSDKHTEDGSESHKTTQPAPDAAAGAADDSSPATPDVTGPAAASSETASVPAVDEPNRLTLKSGQTLPVVPVSMMSASEPLFSIPAPSLGPTGGATPTPASEPAATVSTPADGGDEPRTAASPWEPMPSFGAATGRPLRKSNRRTDPDIHTVLNNILSIIGGNVRVRGGPVEKRPSTRPSSRINNRGPPQFLAVTRPAERPPAGAGPPPPFVTARPPPPAGSVAPPAAPVRFGVQTSFDGPAGPPPPRTPVTEALLSGGAVATALTPPRPPVSVTPSATVPSSSVSATSVTDSEGVTTSSSVPSSSPPVTSGTETTSEGTTPVLIGSSAGSSLTPNSAPFTTPSPPTTVDSPEISSTSQSSSSAEIPSAESSAESSTELHAESTTVTSLDQTPASDVGVSPADPDVSGGIPPAEVTSEVTSNGDLTTMGSVSTPGTETTTEDTTLAWTEISTVSALTAAENVQESTTSSPEVETSSDVFSTADVEEPTTPQSLEISTASAVLSTTEVQEPAETDSPPVRIPALGVGEVTVTTLSEIDRLDSFSPTTNNEVPTVPAPADAGSASDVSSSPDVEPPPALTSAGTVASARPAAGGRRTTRRPWQQGTPPLPAVSGRPGIVLDAAAPRRPAVAQPRPRPEASVVTGPAPAAGEVFDVTVSAAQGFGAESALPTRPRVPTGQPYVIPVDINELRVPGDIITEPDPVNNFVSIDGRRTYFNLDPTDVSRRGSYQTVGAGIGFSGPVRPKPPLATPPWRRRPASNARPAGGAVQSGRPAYPSQRRRPSPPPIRIDTCIVGDDSTCKQAFNERCLTEGGVSSCVCRPGYSRLRPRTECKRVVSVVMSVKVDGVDDHRLSWDSDFGDPETEAFQQLAWDARNAINSAMTQTTMKDIYMGNNVNSFYSLGGRLILNTTVSLLDTAQTRRREVKNELQRQMIKIIKAKDNNIGDSTLFIEGPLNPIPGIQDLNECSEPSLHDCDENAVCRNVFGSFLCRCQPGFDDRHRSDVARAGRHCDSCTDSFCGGHGTCQIENGLKTCLCRGSYYGARCDIDGEVLGAALGATAAAALVIIATFIGLCKWSKHWNKGQGRGKVEMGTLGAGNTFSYVKPGAAGQHANFALGMDERLHWARMADTMGHQNIYAPEPMYTGPPRSQLPAYASQAGLGVGPVADGPASLGMPGSRSVFAAHARRSMTPVPLAEGPPPSRGSRTPVPLPDYDDDRDERQSTVRGYPPARPRSRGSMANQSLVYYDIHDFEQRETLRGGGRGPPAKPMSTYSSRTSNYFR